MDTGVVSSATLVTATCSTTATTITAATSAGIVATEEVAPLVNVRVTADGTQFVPFIRREVPRDVGYINTVHLNSHTSAQVVTTAAPVSTTTFSSAGTFVGVRIDRTDAPLFLPGSILANLDEMVRDRVKEALSKSFTR